jgi:protocatechuate 3,4-dioxygenase beta subunit
MTPIFHAWTRRRFVQGVAVTTLAATWENFFAIKGAYAQELMRTPAQTEGPFYPDRLPLDTDNDLIVINDSITPAIGTITHLTGRILDQRGDPVRNATVEIWQCDQRGNYLHTRGANPNAGNPRDANFQGFGRFLTGSTGEYYFRTIRPVPYPGRTPHIHYKVKIRGRPEFVTQLYIRGESRNANDGIYNSLSVQGRQAVSADFNPTRMWRITQYAASWDVVLGATPQG